MQARLEERVLLPPAGELEYPLRGTGPSTQAGKSRRRLQ